MERVEGLSRGRKWMLEPAIILLVVGAFILAHHEPWNWVYFGVCLIVTLVASGAAWKIAHQIRPLFAFFRSVFKLMLWNLAGLVLGMSYLPSARSGWPSKEEWERYRSNLDPWAISAYENSTSALC